MRILCCGDVLGKSGRQVILENIEDLRERWRLDFVLVNGENAAHGFGITEKICKTFYEVGVDVITTGNHVWDQRAIMNYIDSDPRLLRPINYPAGTPGKGYGIFETASGKKVLVINPMGLLFMDPIEDPFKAVQEVLVKYEMGRNIDAIVVDMHGEATSEKMGMGHFCDGKVSVVVGSHSHVPTADTQILPGGTAYQTDMGMCGDYDSVIGMTKESALARFTNAEDSGRLGPATGEATLCAVLIETDDATGLTKSVQSIRMGGRLAEALPA